MQNSAQSVHHRVDSTVSRTSLRAAIGGALAVANHPPRWSLTAEMNSHHPHHHLLFGLVAVSKQFLSAEQLAKATLAWTKNGNRPFTRYRNRGLLSDFRRWWAPPCLEQFAMPSPAKVIPS
jgi:hypothetical protein